MYRDLGTPPPRRHQLVVTVAALAMLAAASGAAGQSLRGGAGSLDLQNDQASRHGFTFSHDAEEVLAEVERGSLVAVTSSPELTLKEVSFPYARPAVRDFVELLAEKHLSACGDPLVVTSLTRPRTRQPSNASRRSVHPAGMAMDLRRPWNRSCRTWLEVTLLSLEAAGVLDATLEWNPAHYHVALFPREYRDRGEEMLRLGKQTHYRVGRGDTLWKIAARLDTTVDSVKQANGLRSNRIYIDQVLQVPTGE